MTPIQRGILALFLAASAAALAQQPLTAVEEIERYRAALADGNPAELWEARGEAIWKEKRGPKNASLEQCDLGRGPGVVKGAYTVLPKYFKDTDTALLEFSSMAIEETRAISDNVLIDLDKDANLVSMTIEHAGRLAALPEVHLEEIGTTAA